MTPLLSREEIVRELKRYRYDRHGAENGGFRVPLKVFAEHIGLCRQTINSYIIGDFGISEPARARLSQAIADVRAGRLRFVRRNRVWQAEGKAVEDI